VNAHPDSDANFDCLRDVVGSVARSYLWYDAAGVMFEKWLLKKCAIRIDGIMRQLLNQTG